MILFQFLFSLIQVVVLLLETSKCKFYRLCNIAKLSSCCYYKLLVTPIAMNWVFLVITPKQFNHIRDSQS